MTSLFKLIIGFSFFATFSLAQPILTQDNCIPIIGTVYEIEILDTSSIFPGVSGANVTWDFSSAVNLSWSSTFTFDDVSTSLNAGSYPNANLVRYSSHSEQFFSTTAGNYNYFGYQEPSNNISYSDCIIMLPFPFTYGNDFIDNFSATGSIAQGNFSYEGTNTIEADAYGTLILNGITLNDVLRIKTNSYAERVQNSTTYVIESVIYQWYKPGISDAVLNYTETSFDGFPPHSSIKRQSTFSILKQITSSRVVPNPIQTIGKIFVDGEGKKTANFYDLYGNKAFETIEFSENEILLNRSDYNSGVYFYTIQNDAGLITQGKVVFI